MEQKQTTIDLLIYKHFTHTKLHHLALEKAEGKLPNTWGNSGKSWSHLPALFRLINTRSKKIKPHIYPVFSFRSATPGTKKGTRPLGR